MGLDSVQIIVDTENCFGIKIEDREAEKMRTVGDLVDYVWINIKHKNTKACMTQILFFRLRKFFVEQLDISPNQFKQDSHFSEFGKRKELNNLLKKLELELKLKLPNIFTGDRVLLFFKAQSDTVQDLIDGIIYKNIKELDREYGITKDAVFSIIASITHEIVGVPRKDIIPSAKFVDDLGVS